MKNFFITILILSAFIIKAEAKKVDGQIIYKNETVDVIMKIPVDVLTQEPDYEKLQARVVCFKESGEKIVVKPKDALEIRFTVGSENIRMLSRKNNLKFPNVIKTSPYEFIKLEIDGEVQLFKYYINQNTPGAPSAPTPPRLPGAPTPPAPVGNALKLEKYLIQKVNGKLEKVNEIGFKKDMKAFFYDCPELTTKIENKEFNRWDIMLIVNYYNKNCAEQKY